MLNEAIMADDPNKPGDAPEKPGPAAGSGRTAYYAKKPMPDVPPSKPLQWFLLAAFVITAAAYLVGQWTQATTNQTQARQKDKLHLLVQSQNEFLSHCKMGDEAFAKKRYDQAAAEYRLALQARDNAEGHQYLGQALLKKGNPDDAFAQFREALRINPALVNAASDWGLALAAQGQPEEASRVLHDALQSNPESGLLHYNLAATLLQIRTNGPSLSDEALLHFVKASRDKVDSPAFWCAYGQLLNHLGRHAEAATQLQRAVSEDESMAAAQFQLALAEERLGQYADAIAHYEKVLTLNKDDTDTLNSLALLYATATNSEVRTAKMAVQLAIRACDATSNQNARYMDTLARSYAADGDFFQAITWEDKAIHRATQLNELALAREFEAREAMFMEHKSL